METEISLLPLMERYFNKDSADAAHGLEAMDEDEALEILRALPPHLSAKAVRHLPNDLAARLLEDLPQDKLKAIVDGLDTQQGAGIFLRLPHDSREKFLEHLSVEKKKKIQELLSYPEESAGRIMTTDVLAFHSDLKVREAVEKVRSMEQKKTSASYIYVVDNDNRLVGIMNMRDMLLAQDDTTLGSIMRTNVFTVECFMDREKVAEELQTRKFFAAPVVDQEGQLLGVVKAEKLIAGIQEEATEDLQKMFGVGGDERAFSSVWFSLRTRLPWLHVNLATAFLAATVVSLFEDVIAKITVLAVYLPVVAGQGGNAGAQSLAVVMRGLVMREIPARKVKTLILKETFIGIINGIVIGIVTAMIAWLWQGNPYMGLVIGLGMVVNLAVAGLSGSAIPLTMKALGLDPAQCSNIILTTITDVMGFFAFLGFAVLLQEYLV
ncbi:MAG: magnesium transporter [Candidatus Omnitrophota bacterium]|nr:magnesium transporter [Candidatus Omnitrophota bacterium]